MRQVEHAAAGGLWAVGFVAYEAAPAFDGDLVVRQSDQSHHPELPLLWFGLWERRILNRGEAAPGGGYELSDWRPTVSKPEFATAIGAVRDRIILGDTYQVNYTIRLRAGFAGDPVTLYRDLVAAQSGGYGAYLDTGRYQIVSASPELFFDRLRAARGLDRIVTRPMKGTAPRGRWHAEDEERLRALRESKKDAAENLIIVDLLRNDLGRIARFGSVRVDELLVAERYDTVWQLTSTISADIEGSMPLTEVFGGLFPCGSITGAPKVKTMEIIAATETSPRGVYTGAIGYVAPAGVPGPRASFSVGIRTVVLDSATGEAEYGVGGGVTYDSTAAGEYEETRVKAAVLRHGAADFSLLETIRWDPVSGWAWLDLHLERLEESADYFGIRFQRERVLEHLDGAIRAASAPLRIRLVVDRSGAPDLSVAPLPGPTSIPVRVAVDFEPVDTSSPFRFHKTTRRDIFDERRARHPGVDDVLVVNERGLITESTIANVAARLEGRWVTPPIADGCLPGVYRRVLLEAGRIAERSLSPADLEAAEHLALLNSVRLWREARLVAATD